MHQDNENFSNMNMALFSLRSFRNAMGYFIKIFLTK